MNPKIAFLTLSVSRDAGGLFNSVRRLAQELSVTGAANCSVLSIRDEHTDEDMPEWQPLTPRAFPKIGPPALGYAPGLRRGLLDTNPDIVRVDGLWTYRSLVSLQWHRRTGRPHVIAPRGMLDAWALGNSGWKKKLAAAFFEEEHLRSAACLHALGEAEARSFRAYGLTNPICVVPNGVDLPEPAAESTPAGAPFSSGQKVLFYLGRIHPKKGLVNLLRAWKAARTTPGATEWALAIAGWDQGGHERELRRLSTDLGVADSVHFPGPKFGREKEACFRASAAFVLPSLSEGLPMAVLEAWAHGKPVLMTPECNLPEGFAAGAAVRVEHEAVAIDAGLTTLFGMTDADRQTMGARGLALVKERFVWQKIAGQMHAVHEWMLGGGNRPDFVQTLKAVPR